MRKRVNDEFNQTNILNTTSYINWYSRLSLIAKTTYKWEGLPESCNARYLEECLFKYGISCFDNNEMYGLINSECHPVNKFNLYNEAIKYHLHSFIFDYDKPTDELVIVRNNADCLPTLPMVERYAYKLSLLERAIECNTDEQKFSKIIKCDDKQLFTIKNLIEKYEGRQPIIIGNKDLSVDVETLDLNSPFIAKDLYDLYTATYEECMRYFGITTGNDKAERVQVGELEIANNETNINLEQGLKYRRLACDELNSKYGLNVSVNKFDYNEYKGVPENEENRNGDGNYSQD